MTGLVMKTLPYRWMPLTLNGTEWPNHPLSCRIERKIARFFLKWEGTPYMSGQMMVGEGTDCIRFLASFVDAMTGKQHIVPERLPQDYSMHTKHGAFRVMKQILRLYPTMKPMKKATTLEPGDVIVVGPKGGGPSHVMIVGFKHNTLWHASNLPGICWTGWGLIEGYQKIVRVYRFTDRNDWGRDDRGNHERS